MREIIYHPDDYITPTVNKFGEIDDILIAFAQRYNMRIQLEYKDSPVRCIKFQDGIVYQISIKDSGIVIFNTETQERIFTERKFLYFDLKDIYEKHKKK